jgi:hypothetical protein
VAVGLEASSEPRMVTAATTTALVWGRSGQVDTVLYFEPEPDDPTDSGFSLLRADAPRLEPRPDTPVDIVCIHCVLDEWPGIGRGLELAREHGAVSLVGGVWRLGK